MARNLNFCFSKMRSSSEDHSRPLVSPNPSPYIRTFNSLYENASSENLLCESGASVAPDFATAFASRRFFFSSPGRSNSIIDSSSLSSSASSSSSRGGAVTPGSVAIPTDSSDPYLDFRRSMQEMVDAREIRDVREDWAYLNQLLTCYLSLNPKSTHKYIVRAFADLLVSLVASPAPAPDKKGKMKVSRHR